ncbi:hypothetical protein OF83DRAFT_1136127 [Amylostereum chailletii]|nr:hypothetical protein OF83DRAFT_1136127 [Amylostereum chailletii]
MFSFAKIATFAALAFGVFTSAMPTGVESRAVEARGASDLTGVLADLKVGLDVNVNLLAAVTADNYSYDHVNGIVLDIKATIDVAVDACKALPAGAIGTGDILALLSVVINVRFLLSVPQIVG